jgi:hypothetical protein
LFSVHDLLHNNNNQAFYSQASWDGLEMKSTGVAKQRQNKGEKHGHSENVGSSFGWQPTTDVGQQID